MAYLKEDQASPSTRKRITTSSDTTVVESEAKAPKPPKAEKAAKPPKAEKVAKAPKVEKVVAPKAEKTPKPPKAEQPAPILDIREVPHKSIKVDYSRNPRTAGMKGAEGWLATQLEQQALPSLIATSGLQQPLIVREMADGSLWLEEGYRRYKSIELLLKGKVKNPDGTVIEYTEPNVTVVVGKDGMTDLDWALLSLATNAHVEWEAPARCKQVTKLHEMGMSLGQIGQALNLSEAKVQAYLDIAANPSALKALLGDEATLKSSDVFNACLSIPGTLQNRILPESTIAKLTTAAKNLATETKVTILTEEVIRQKAKDTATVDLKDVVLTPQEKKEIREAAEPSSEEKGRAFDTLLEKAEQIAGDGEITQEVAKEATQQVQRETGVTIVKERPGAVKPPVVGKLGLTDLRATIAEARIALKDNRPEGWLNVNVELLAPDDSPQLHVLDAILGMIDRGEFSAEKLVETVLMNDQWLRGEDAPEGI